VTHIGIDPTVRSGRFLLDEVRARRAGAAGPHPAR
jgi:hypothetical protein